MIEHLLTFGGWYLLAAIAFVLFLLLFLSALRRTTSRRVSGRRGSVSGWSMRAAEELLQEKGYRLEDAHVHASISARQNGARVRLPLQADFIAERRGKRYVVLVSTEGEGLSLGSSLDYLLAFRCDGVVLADVSSFELEVLTVDVEELLARPASRGVRNREAKGWSWNQATVATLREEFARARTDQERARLAAQLRGLGEPIQC